MTDPNSDKPESNRAKLAAWLGIIGAIIGIAGFLLDAPDKISKLFSPNHSQLHGIGLDSEGQGVPNASIDVFAQEGDTQRIGSGQTSSTGDFKIPVQAGPDVFVWVEVSKDGHMGDRANRNTLDSQIIPFR